MGQIESALGHHFDQIPEAELVAQIPPYAQDDHLTIEVPPCKQLLKAAQLAHHPSSDSRKTTLPDGTCYLHQSLKRCAAPLATMAKSNPGRTRPKGSRWLSPALRWGVPC